MGSFQDKSHIHLFLHQFKTQVTKSRLSKSLLQQNKKWGAASETKLIRLKLEVNTD